MRLRMASVLPGDAVTPDRPGLGQESQGPVALFFESVFAVGVVLRIEGVHPDGRAEGPQPGGAARFVVAARAELGDDFFGPRLVAGQAGQVGLDPHHRRVVRGEVDVDVAAVGDLAGVLDRFGALHAKVVPHLFGGLHVEVTRIVQPALVGLDLAHRDAAQRVVRVPVVAGQEVRVVVAYQRKVQLLCEPDRVFVQLDLQLLGVVLQLQIEAWLAVGAGFEDFGVPFGLGLGPLVVRFVAALVILLQVKGDRRPQVSVDRNQSVGPLLERAFVHPRLEIKPLEVGVTRQLDQVLPAGLVLGQQHQVEAAVADAGVFLEGAVARASVHVRGHVGLDAQDGLDALLLRQLVELGAVVQVAVVGDRHRVHAQFFHPLHQPVQPVAAVQQAVLAVQVQVHESRIGFGGGHNPDCTPVGGPKAGRRPGYNPSDTYPLHSGA